MKQTLMQIYNHLPGGARHFAATAHGYYLRSWRYGKDSEDRVAATLERDSWSGEQWQQWQEERLSYILHRAATRVPYYRCYWEMRRRAGHNESWEHLENWPILQKGTLREQPEAFLADDCNLKHMYLDHTSGTTGTPLYLWSSRETQREWYAIFEARTRRWHGTSRYENWAILGGQQVVPPQVKKPPFWVWNAALNQLYLSANHLSKQTSQIFVDALARYKITHLIVYTSSATYLAQQIIKQGLKLKHPIKVIFTNAEALFQWQKTTLFEAFQCPIRETYGMGEIAAAASADYLDYLRQWPEVGYVEILSDDNETLKVAETPGRLICTSLLNKDMPLVRYDVGDRVAIVQKAVPTDDSIQLPYLGTIEGRNNDLLIAPDGRRVFWINPIFYGLPVQEAQVIQENISAVHVRYVPDRTFTVETGIEIKKRLEKRLGSVQIIMEHVDRIPREANGKFRPVVNRIPLEERETL